MKGYLLYRRGEETAVVLTCQDDDELFYLLSKLNRTRVKWLKEFSAGLLADFFEKVNGSAPCPEARVISTEK